MSTIISEQHSDNKYKKHSQGKLNAAEALYRWSLKGFEEILGPSHSETLELLITFADLLFEIYRQNVSKVGMNSFPSVSTVRYCTCFCAFDCTWYDNYDLEMFDIYHTVLY